MPSHQHDIGTSPPQFTLLQERTQGGHRASPKWQRAPSSQVSGRHRLREKASPSRILLFIKTPAAVHFAVVTHWTHSIAPELPTLTWLACINALFCPRSCRCSADIMDFVIIETRARCGCSWRCYLFDWFWFGNLCFALCGIFVLVLESSGGRFPITVVIFRSNLWFLVVQGSLTGSESIWWRHFDKSLDRISICAY